jgi:outer membrane protein insertion porin family
MTAVSHPLVLAAAMLSLAGAAEAQQGGQTELTAGAAYSSTRGAIGSIGLEGTNILNTGVDLGLEFRQGDEGKDARLRLRYTHELGDTRLGSDTRLIFSASHSESDWDDDSFSSSRSRLSAALAADVAPRLSLQGGLFWQHDEIDDIREETSPLILDEQGSSDAAGIELSARLGQIDRRQLPTHGEVLDLTYTASLGGDRRFQGLEVSGLWARSPAAGWVISAGFGAGAIEAKGDGPLSIHDRAFLGGRAPRGYGIGGVGPRDYVEDAYDTALGGQRYALGSVELRRDIAPQFSVGAFVDAGSVWKLDGPPVGGSGVIDDSYDLRSAAGLALYWNSPLGTLNLNVAAPIDHREHDDLSRISLNLLSSF